MIRSTRLKALSRALRLVLCGLTFPAGGPALAENDAADAGLFAIHGQTTFVLQGTPGFASPYSGENSFEPRQRKETFDATLYLGVHPWKGFEIWANPEIDQGFGLSGTHGIAGFTSAEAYKLGQKSPYLRLQRLFARQTIDLGGVRQQVDGAANAFASTRTADRLVITAGLISVGDIFDASPYAHDPRGDFLNWSIVDAGSFDYAAQAWGYTTGAALEWYRGPWTVRFGLFNLTRVSNGASLEERFRQYQLDAELERRFLIDGQDGSIVVTAFRNRGRFGSYDDAVALATATGATPDVGTVLRRRTRAGVSLDFQQALSGAVGLFARGGIADGAIAPYEFTDIARTVSGGLSVKGVAWGRSGDTVGLGAAVNGASAAERRYLAAGGLGLLVGDGQLKHYRPEAIFETYYAWAPIKPLAVSLDYQRVGNPGFNRDRGPANVLALRVHAGF